MGTKDYTKTRFSASDAALVMIDHQSGVMQLVHDYSPAELRNNVIGLAKLGKVFNLPTVLTTSYSQGPNGPFIPEVVSMHADAPLIDRPGIISAWDDPKVVAAIGRTGSKNLIMADVTCQVCLAFPAMQAAAEGFNVYGAIDASGSPDAAAREMTVARLVAHGVTRVRRMLAAIDLDDQTLFAAAEIDHIGSDRILPNEFRAIHLARAQPVPKPLLDLSRIMAKTACAVSSTRCQSAVSGGRRSRVPRIA